MIFQPALFIKLFQRKAGKVLGLKWRKTYLAYQRLPN
jgi:hypothetical protein